MSKNKTISELKEERDSLIGKIKEIEDSLRRRTREPFYVGTSLDEEGHLKIEKSYDGDSIKYKCLIYINGRYYFFIPYLEKDDFKDYVRNVSNRLRVLADNFSQFADEEVFQNDTE